MGIQFLSPLTFKCFPGIDFSDFKVSRFSSISIGLITQEILARPRPNLPTNLQQTEQSFLLHGKGYEAEHGGLALEPKMDDHSFIFSNLAHPCSLSPQRGEKRPVYS